MTPPMQYLRHGLCLGATAAFVLAGCSKSSEPESSTPATTSSTPAATASESSATTTPPASTGTSDMQATADSMAATAQRAAKESESAMAGMKTQAEAAATKAPAAPEAGSASGQGTAPDSSGLAAMAGQATSAMTSSLQDQAAQYLAQYSDELVTLKSGAAKLKELIDKNADALPAGAMEKYQEFNGLLPELSGMVESLKNYQTADLQTLLPKLQQDFAQAQKLYTELAAMVQ